MTDYEMYCDIFQHGELYNCGIFIDLKDGHEPVTFGVVRADKVKINYNTNKKAFTVAFINGGTRNVECSVSKVYIHDLEKENRIQLPSYDAEWPYDDIEIYYKEE